MEDSGRVTFSLWETTTAGDDNHLPPAQFTGRGILAFAHFSPALYLRLCYASRRAASTRCRLGSRAKRLTTLSPVHASMLARSAFSIQACVQSYSAMGKRDDSRVARSSSRNAVSFSPACTTKRFPLSRCASAIQIVRPQRSMAETQPQLQPPLLRLSAIVSQYFIG